MGVSSRSAFTLPSLLLIASGIAGAQARWEYVRNDSVKLGVRLDLGAGIAHFSRLPEDRNLLNHYDHGRLVQQSWYGDADGSTWNGKPWRWNPVQGGCWTGRQAGIVLDFQSDGASLYAKTRPINWGGCEVIDAEMEQWIRLAGPVAHVRYRFTNRSRDNAAARHQEMPAIFADHALPNLVRYEGAAPWTGAPLTRSVPGFPNEGGTLSENWAAYVDAQDWGIGAFTPGTSSMTAYRYAGDGKAGPAGSACSYFAPLRTLRVARGFVLEYEIYLTIGRLEAMRAEFRHIHANGTPSRPYFIGTTLVRAPATIRTGGAKRRYSLLGEFLPCGRGGRWTVQVPFADPGPIP